MLVAHADARSTTATVTDRAITTIKPPPRWPGFGLGELWRLRRVLFVLAHRQFRARYSRMVLGVVWVLLEPLLLSFIVAALLTLIFDRGDRYGLPFPVFLFIGWLAFKVFSRVVSQGGSSIRSNGSLVERIYIPRAYFPLSVGLNSLVDLLFMTIALVPLLIWYDIRPGVGLLTVPILVLILYAFSLGLAFFFAAGSLALPDLDFVRGLFVRAWMWISPVIYPASFVPEDIRTLYWLNPMAVVIEGFRWAFAQSPAPPPEAWIIGGVSASVILVAGYAYFRQRQAAFPDQL